MVCALEMLRRERVVRSSEGNRENCILCVCVMNDRQVVGKVAKSRSEVWFSQCPVAVASSKLAIVVTAEPQSSGRQVVFVSVLYVSVVLYIALGHVSFPRLLVSLLRCLYIVTQ